MKRYQIYKPERDNVCSSSTYIVNHIIPLCIKEKDENMFSILFLMQNDTQDENVKDYLSMFFSYDNENDKKFIKNHILNYNNIINNKQQLKMYMDMTDTLDPKNIYSTDLDLSIYEEKKIFYHCYGYRTNYENNKVEELLILFNKSLFVQLNLFFVQFYNYDTTAETIFFNQHFNKVDFIKLDSIKLDGSTKPNPGSMYVLSHYTGKFGRNYYKFHFLSAAILGRRLRNPMGYEPYSTLYKDDTFIDMMFMDHHTNTLFIIYIEKDLTGKYKRTLALKLSENLYNHTNFLDIYKIYTNVKEK